MDPISTPLVTLRDYRDLPTEQLPEKLKESLSQCTTQTLLWTAQRPKKRWYEGLTDHHPLVLASSQRFEQILWLSPGLTPQIPEEWRNECQSLLGDYPLLYKGGNLENYIAAVQRHISRQEKEIFPEVLSSLPDTERALRELGYEHKGLESALQRLPDVLSRHKSGQLASRERERFDLDYYHLLEHNIERKLEAIYPALAAFRKSPSI